MVGLAGGRLVGVLRGISGHWLVGWSVGQTVGCCGWLARADICVFGWLCGWLVRLLVGRRVDWSVGCWNGWLLGCVVA